MSLNKQITVSEVFSAILKNRGRALLTFVLVMVLVVTAFMIWPRQYGSEARLVKLNELDVEAGQLNRNVAIARHELDLFIEKRAESSVMMG